MQLLNGRKVVIRLRFAIYFIHALSQLPPNGRSELRISLNQGGVIRQVITTVLCLFVGSFMKQSPPFPRSPSALVEQIIP